MQRTGRFQIRGEWAGRPLLDFLCARFPYHDRAGWDLRIARGEVSVDACRAAPDQPLTLGAVVQYLPGDAVEPEVDVAVEVLFRDRDLLVLNKSGNLPCHPGGRYFNHTLWALLKSRLGVDAPQFVNRLDRETSGIVLVALTAAAARSCRSQFAARHVRKQYVALVEGAFPAAEVTARGTLRTGTLGGVRRAAIFEPAAAGEAAGAERGSDWAETRCRRIATHGPVSAVCVEPLTGRLHQIRATLRGLGFPVVGDKLYGPDPEIFVRFCKGALTDDDRRLLRMDRQALHAAALRLRHPRTHSEVAFEAPLPPDMVRAITDLDRHGANGAA